MKLTFFQPTVLGTLEILSTVSDTLPDMKSPEYKHAYLDLKPIDYARLCNWIYDSVDGRSPPFGKLLESIYVKSIKYALISEKGLNICVIRGTDNSNNVLDDASIFLDGGRVKESIASPVRSVMQMFLEKYSAVHVVTGHSLGGRLVEIATENKEVLGITFNSYLANKSERIIAFRAEGDIAKLHKGHTDRNLPFDDFNPLTTDSLKLHVDIWAFLRFHSIKYVIGRLEKENNYWTKDDFLKANNVSSKHTITKDRSESPDPWWPYDEPGKPLPNNWPGDGKEICRIS